MAAPAAHRNAVHAAVAAMAAVASVVVVVTLRLLRVPLVGSVSVVYTTGVRSTAVVVVGSASRHALAPAGLARKDRIAQLVGAVVAEGHVAVQGNVVVAPVPDGGVDHAVRGPGEDGADDGSGKDVVPVVVLVDGEGATDEDGAEDGHVGQDELPHGSVLVFLYKGQL